MEIVNFLVIVICVATALIWAMKKRYEIESMKILFTEEKEEYDQEEEESLKREEKITRDAAVIN